MAVPSAELVKAAVETLYSAFADDKTNAVALAGVQALNELRNKLDSLYAVVDIAIVDSADAGVSEFITAEATIAVGVVFRTTTATNDLTDNAFATAKGSAVAIGDIYVVSGADAVTYLGNNEGHAFDFDGETEADFG